MAYPEGSAIEWREYSQRAFEDARQQRKPVFMLISAAWCHWCHVYERESLEAEEIARNLNRHFVPVYVDADKRLDLAREHLAGGWPTTVIFSLQGEKLLSFSGHLNKVALMSLMQDAAEGKLEPEEKASGAREAGGDGPTQGKPAPRSLADIPAFLNEYNSQLAFFFDELYGGFGKGQKFPNAQALGYLALLYAEERKSLWKGMLEKSLQGMARIMDKAEGGFYRYATTREWGEPHYEKMLKENALAAEIYLEAWKILGKEEFRQIAERTYEWLLGNLHDEKNGGFCGSQDADEQYYAHDAGQRKRMAQPYVDRTKYCEWNAQAAISFLGGHRLLAKLQYWEIADGTLEFLERNLITKEGALHYFEEGSGGRLQGLLADNVWASIAFLQAYRVGKQPEHLEAGARLAEYCIGNFYSAGKGGFIERNSASLDMYRSNELRSEVIPYAENAAACRMLLEAHGATGDGKFLKIAKEVLPHFLYLDDDIDAGALAAMAAKKLKSTG